MEHDHEAKQLNIDEEEIRRLIVARLSVLSPDTAISIGSDGSFKRDDLIERVERGDDVGKKFEQMEVEWLRSLKEGVL